MFIEVKAYNSYCLDRLWIGEKDRKVDDYSLDEKQVFKKYLFDHGLDLPAFESLVNGDFPKRNFIPLAGQPYHGRVKQLICEAEDGSANKMVIEADVGQLFLLEAPREVIYVLGHWMGKADLRYVFENGKDHRPAFRPVVFVASG